MIKLLPGKEFEIHLKSGEVIAGKFGTWALKKFCGDRKIMLSDALPQLQTVDGLVEYLLNAVEFTARKNKTAFSYTDVQACDWIDEMGGVESENFLKLIKHSGDETGVVTDEKKSEVN